MAKDKKSEPKLVLEREYIVPLRKEWLKVPKSHRGKKAVKALKQFLAKHMKVYDRDLDKIKIDVYLNNEIRSRGMRKPPAKIRIIAKKYDDGIVRVELAKLSKHIEYKKLKEERLIKRIKKEETKEEEKKPGEKEIKEDVKEKEEASKEETLKISKEEAKEKKHTSSIKETSSSKQNIASKRSQRGR